MAPLDNLLHFFGHAVCHQLPSRTLAAGGHYLPVCARCTGIYFGISLSYIYLIARRKFRVNALPPLGVSIALVALILPMAVDGATSYLGLRHTTNAVRLATGLATGGVLPIFAFPLLSPELVTEKDDVHRRPPFARWYDYLIWAGILAAGGAFAQWSPGWSYYPLALLTVAGIAGIFYNLALALWLMAFEKRGPRWRLVAFVAAAFTVAVFLTGLNLFHHYSLKALSDAGVSPPQ